jgi:tripartite-type tricarboxylate transporter receptor subunit TctC
MKPHFYGAKRVFVSAIFAAASTVCFAQSGDGYPSKPIRLVVPFTPGGTTDILARAIGQRLTQSLGQTVIVDNKPGAGGSLGAEIVARADADGYTLLMGHIGTLAVNPSLYPKLPYDPIKSFAPVAWVARVPNVFAVNSAAGIASIKDFVARAAAAPDKMNYASGGNGSAAHVAFEYFKLRTKTSVQHVPYRGAAPAVTDLLAGQVNAVFTGAPAVMPHVKSGKLRALAVSSKKRMAAFPDLPTMIELGYPDFEADQWYGVVAPANTPAAIINKLNQAINQALASPEVAKQLAGEGAEPMGETPAAYAALIASEIPRWREVVRAGNMKPD